MISHFRISIKKIEMLFPKYTLNIQNPTLSLLKKLYNHDYDYLQP